MSHPGLGAGQMHAGNLASIFPLQSNSKEMQLLLKVMSSLLWPRKRSVSLSGWGPVWSLLGCSISSSVHPHFFFSLC